MTRPGTASVWEAAREVGASCDLLTGLVSMAGGAAVGPARTLVIAEGDNLAVHEALGRCRTGDVLIVGVERAAEAGPVRHGYWGELLSLAARRAGLAGVVVDGGLRDVARLRELAFPVFARGACPRGTTNDGHDLAEGHEVVVIAGVPVRPGDLVVGDEDGVAVVVAEAAAEVIAAAGRRDDREERYARQILSGRSTLDVLGLPEARGGDP